MRCANCHKHNDYQICSYCWQYAISQLKTFPQGYLELEKELMPSSSATGERVSGSKTAPIPVRLEALHLRTGGIAQPLMQHESEMRKSRQETRITWRGDELNRITITCEYHTTRENWTFHNYDGVETLAKEIIAISNKIKYVLGQRSEEIVIGTCPTVGEDEKPCGAKLKVDPAMKSTDIVCRVCKTVWDSTKWRLLGRMLDA